MRLQCSACGAMVSEFAARCPACRRPVDDAIELPEPGPEPDPAPEPDPGPEPAPAAGAGRLGTPRHRVWRAGAVAAGALLAGAAATGALVSSPDNTSSSPARASLIGQILARSPAGMITWVDAVDGKPLRRPPLEGLGTLDPVAVSADGAILLDASGALVTIDVDRIAARSTAVARFLTRTTEPARSSPFADHDQAVLLLTRSGSQPAGASLVGLSDGHRVDLGMVDTAGADPQSLGAFVSVPSGSGSNPGVATRYGDARVELRASGAAPVVLATASQLDHDVGWSPATAVRLDVYPNSIGDAVAVVLNPLNSAPGDRPMVILTRQGAVLAALTDRAGPAAGSQPQWSPGGHQIAYPTFTASGDALAIVTETGAAEAYPAPTPTTFGSCIWSPASTDVLCQSRSAGSDHWLYATSTSTRLLSTTSSGDPITWLPILPSPGA